MKNYIKLSIASAVFVAIALNTRIGLILLSDYLQVAFEDFEHAVFALVNTPLLIALLLAIVSALLWFEDVISYAKEMEL